MKEADTKFSRKKTKMLFRLLQQLRYLLEDASPLKRFLLPPMLSAQAYLPLASCAQFLSCRVFRSRESYGSGNQGSKEKQRSNVEGLVEEGKG
ncbi:hypothetical protein V6N13_098318 [Hibiscus sabdariffa]|uniref:Uncharacterized protein n=1 Tax=Hibiscus sabdariffa TaxID=183260 RepID=A0ABR2EDV8_9ROSI